MSAQREPDVGRDPELERALAGVERPAARPAFRSSLRERFLDVAQDEPAPRAAPTPAAAPAEDRRPRRRLALLVTALAAAAVIVLVVQLARPRPPVWRVLDGTRGGACLVDGRRVDAGDRQALADALLSASEIDTLDATLRLAVRDEAVLELGPGTRLAQVRFHAAGAYSLRQETGSLRVATRPAFHGRGMTVLTDDVEVRVTGTMYAVDVDEKGTCVCCLEGTLLCRPLYEAEAHPVEAGKLCFGFRDRSPSAWGAAYEPHLRPLRELR